MNLIDAKVLEILSVEQRENNFTLNLYSLVKVKYVDEGGEGTTELMLGLGEKIKVGDTFQH